MIKIMIFEDQSNLRESLKLLLDSEDGIELLAVYPNCKNADKHVLKHLPDVVLMDIDMPIVNGIEGVKLIKHVDPSVQIIMLTVFEDDDKIFESIKAGANGYVLKKSISNELLPAIYNASTGGSSISPGVAAKLLNSFRESTSKITQDTFSLSKREKEVLNLLTQGYTYKRIAAELFVSIDTIGTHLKNIYSKLQVNSAPEAISKVLKLNIRLIENN